MYLHDMILYFKKKMALISGRRDNYIIVRFCIRLFYLTTHVAIIADIIIKGGVPDELYY